jgi:transcriptional regulator with AAA-type ATPase domain
VPTLRERIEASPAELAELVALLVQRTIGAESLELVTYVLDTLGRDVPRGYAWPGNVRELEQAVRRILLTGSYTPDADPAASLDAEDRLVARLREGNLSADELLSGYSALLYRRLGSYAAVAERTGLDPRTSRKYVLSAKSG